MAPAQTRERWALIAKSSKLTASQTECPGWRAVEAGSPKYPGEPNVVTWLLNLI